MKKYTTGRKYLRVFLVGLQEALEYRVRFFTDLIIGFLPVAVHILLWSSIFRPLGPGGTIKGYTFVEMLSYLLLSVIVANYIRTNRIENVVASDIKNGGLSKYLLKPIDNFGYHFCASLGEKVLYFVFVFIPVLLMVGYFLTGTGGFIKTGLCLSALFGAYLLHFLFNYFLGLLAFWFTSVTSFFYMKNMILIFLAGGLLPLRLFPNFLVRLSEFLPFQYMIYFPVNTFLSAQTGEIAIGIGIQFLWIILFYFLTRVLWRLGIRRYGAVGN